ncbi:hypothetical protein DFH27DRAFT_656427 [Peziza echinospora]|nr:hypothetical protein DFH27DRAFT_656427 [Peziza echinospora]
MPAAALPPIRENVSHVHLVIWVIAGLCVLSTAVVVLRIWVRMGMMKQALGWDDATMVISAALCIAESALICATTKYGLGRHIEFVDPSNYVPFFKLAYAAIVVYISLIFIIKQSLILFYWRLSRSAYFHGWCWAYLAMNTVVWITFTLLCIFSCKPIGYFWDRSQPGKCMNLEKVYLINAGFFVFMDVAALLLPIRAVWELNMKKKKKIQLISLFSFGLFVCIASFVRMTTMFNFNNETDATWVMVTSNIWSMLEINIGIMTVCVPVVKPFFTRLLWPKLTGLSYHGSSHSSSGKAATNDSIEKPGQHAGRYQAGAQGGKGGHIAGVRREEKGIRVTTQHFIEHEMRGGRRPVMDMEMISLGPSEKEVSIDGGSSNTSLSHAHSAV